MLGLESILAPKSRTWVGPVRVGTADIIAGLSTPLIVLSTNRAMDMSAPVLPALTQASASPFLTRLIATLIEESFLCLRATEGESLILITSEA